MAKGNPQVNVRFPSAMLARLDAACAARNQTRSEYVLDAVQAMLDADDEPASVKTGAAKSSATPKVAAAREALKVAEAKTGVRSVMDSVPMLGTFTRGPMQKSKR